MRGHEESRARCALKRRRELGPMSDSAFAELERAVERDPRSFVADAEEHAFLELADALVANEDAMAHEDLLDDDEYQKSRTRRLSRLRGACEHALSVWGGCVDAKVVLATVQERDPNDLLERLLQIRDEADAAAQGKGDAGASTEAVDAWDDVFARPRLRLDAAIARTLSETTRHTAAKRACEQLLETSPSDPLGARLTLALTLARLEDEEGLDALDARFARRGNAWMHLSRALLMYKLDRMGAARRALNGFGELCQGGAYALLRPTFVDLYLPDRPAAGQGTFEEATLAVHEADPVVVDTPDFAAWAEDQERFRTSARAFARRNGLDWDR